jgi:hypothetical protein
VEVADAGECGACRGGACRRLERRVQAPGLRAAGAAGTHVEGLDHPGQAGQACEEGDVGGLQVQVVLEEEGQREARQAQDALHEVD